MVNYWVFVVNDWKSPSGKKLKGTQIFNILKNNKVWGIGDKTPNRKRLSKGDKVSFQPDSEYEYNVDGEKLYRMFTKNITLIYD